MSPAESVVRLDGRGRQREGLRVSGQMLAGAPRWILGYGVLALSLSACPSANRADPAQSPTPEPSQISSRSAAHAHSSDARPRDSAVGAQPKVDVGEGVEISAPCVLHAGDSHRHRREILKPGGKPGGSVESASCSFSAECVWAPDRESAGDGNVGVECIDRRCTCRRMVLSNPATPATSTFVSDVPCSTTEEAQRLLVEHCMKGMKVERR